MELPCFGHGLWQGPQLEKFLDIAPWHVQLGKQEPNGSLHHPLGSHGVHPVMDVATDWLQEVAIQKWLMEPEGMVAEGDATGPLPQLKMLLGKCPGFLLAHLEGLQHFLVCG